MSESSLYASKPSARELLSSAVLAPLLGLQLALRSPSRSL